MLYLSFSILAFILLCLLYYFYQAKQYRKDPVIVTKDFGSTLTPAQRGVIFNNKIRQQRTAYNAYLGSMIVSFLLGALAIGKFIFWGTDRSFLVDALSISGGVAATVSFKRLYNKCTIDVNNLK